MSAEGIDSTHQTPFLVRGVDGVRRRMLPSFYNNLYVPIEPIQIAQHALEQQDRCYGRHQQENE